MSQILEITNGSIVCDGNVCFGGIAGASLEIRYFSESSCVHCTDYRVILGDIPQRNVFDGFVTVGTDTCRFSLIGGPTAPPGMCGEIDLFLTGTPQDETSGFFNYSVPFSATGHLNVGPGYDVVGGGTMTASNIASCFTSSGGPIPCESSPIHSYQFAVPEPSTFLLLMLGVISFVVQRAWRRRAHTL